MVGMAQQNGDTNHNHHQHFHGREKAILCNRTIIAKKMSLDEGGFLDRGINMLDQKFLQHWQKGFLSAFMENLCKFSCSATPHQFIDVLDGGNMALSAAIDHYVKYVEEMQFEHLCFQLFFLAYLLTCLLTHLIPYILLYSLHCLLYYLLIYLLTYSLNFFLCFLNCLITYL